ncbi:MAG: hypothetical protein EOO92_02480 [Pedobacter sp.]|nr:MAG: hypothetical protein EOO92_02480 [Pedobacter sp.]
MQTSDYDFSTPRRQSATGIIVMFANSLQQIVRNLAIPVIVLIFKAGVGFLAYIILGLVVLTILIGVFAYFQYKAFTYYLDEEQEKFVINEGVFVKTNLTIHLDKIQQVNINQSLLQRIIGIYTLQIDTAGSDKKEGSIKAIDKQSAEELKRRLLDGSADASFEKNSSAELVENVSERSIPFLKLSPLTLLKIGATSNYGQTIALVVAFLAAGIQSLKDINEIFDVDREQVGAAIQQGATFVSICILIVMVLIFLLIINIIRTFIKYFDFEVLKQKDSLVVNSGLFAKKNTFLNAHRVQISIYTQNFFQRKMNMLDMRMTQNAAVAEPNKQNKSSDIEIPGCDSSERDKILRMIFDEVPALGAQLIPNYRFVFLSVIIWMFIPLVIFSIVGYNNQATLSYTPVFIAYLLGVAILLYYSYKNHRLYVSDKHIVKKQGIWDVDHQIILPHKIQAITIKQMLWHRKANIGHITCHTAAGNISFYFGDYDYLKVLMNYWLYQVESSEKDWM